MVPVEDGQLGDFLELAPVGKVRDRDRGGAALLRRVFVVRRRRGCRRRRARYGER